jgi:hypothetical protein
MDEVLTSTLQDAVFGRLDYLEHLADEGDQQSKAALADTEIGRLTGAFRALLAEHAPDEHGRCPHCSGWLRPQSHPCSVWDTAHRHLLTAENAPPPRTGRHTFAPGHASTRAPVAS